MSDSITESSSSATADDGVVPTNQTTTTTTKASKFVSRPNDDDAQPSYTKLIPGPEYFTKIREAYLKTVADRADPHDVHVRKAVEQIGAAASSSSSTPHITDALVPFEIRNAGPRGRGLFATQAIPKGGPVWGASLYGIFYHQDEWYRFLDLLEPSEDFVEAVHEWSWAMYWGEEDDEESESESEEEYGNEETSPEREEAEKDKSVFVVGLTLDEGSLMNHGSKKVTVWGEHLSNTANDADEKKQNEDDVTHTDQAVASNNLLYVASKKGEYFGHYIATRDIAADEEILVDYSDFHSYEREHDWDWWDADVYFESKQA